MDYFNKVLFDEERTMNEKEDKENVINESLQKLAKGALLILGGTIIGYIFGFISI